MDEGIRGKGVDDGQGEHPLWSEPPAPETPATTEPATTEPATTEPEPVAYAPAEPAPAEPAQPVDNVSAPSPTPPPSPASEGSTWQPSGELFAVPRAAGLGWQAPVEPFVSARGVGRLAIGLLLVAGFVAVATLVHFVTGLQLVARTTTGSVTLAELNAFDSVTASLGWIQIAVSVVSAVVFLRWLWRSVRNATELGATGLIVSPRGAVTAWLVPIRNLWKPYQVVRNLHDRLLDPLTSSAGVWLIRLWWVFWLLGDVPGWLVSFGGRPDTMPAITRQWTLMGLSSAVTVADAVLAIAVVLQLQRLADAREVNRAGDPNGAIELVRRSQRPVVTRAPFGFALAALVVAAIPLGLAYPAAASVGSGVGSGAWQVYTAPDGSFSVEAPLQPVVVAVPAKTSASGITTSGETFTFRLSKDETFLINYQDYPSGLLEAIDPSQAYKNMIKAMGVGTVVSSQRSVTISGLPAEAISATQFSTLKVEARFIVKGDRVYVVEADWSINANVVQSDVDRFLNSFTLK